MEEQHEPIDWGKVTSQLNAGMTEFAKQLNAFVTTFMTTFAEAMKPAIESGIEAMQSIHDAIHEAYIQDGAIYGDTHEGLLRWMQEQGEINRLRAQAERIEQHQEAVRDFKRMIAEKREQS